MTLHKIITSALFDLEIASVTLSVPTWYKLKPRMKEKHQQVGKFGGTVVVCRLTCSNFVHKHVHELFINSCVHSVHDLFTNSLHYEHVHKHVHENLT